MDYGRRIRYLRRQKGISQQELAAKINLPRNTLSAVETGNLGISRSEYDRISGAISAVPFGECKPRRHLTL